MKLKIFSLENKSKIEINSFLRPQKGRILDKIKLVNPKKTTFMQIFRFLTQVNPYFFLNFSDPGNIEHRKQNDFREVNLFLRLHKNIFLELYYSTVEKIFF